jgi:hypothetical protein
MGFQATGKIVEDHEAPQFRITQQAPQEMAADEAGAPGDEDVLETRGRGHDGENR